jgi:hypothetical protein
VRSFAGAQVDKGEALRLTRGRRSAWHEGGVQDEMGQDWNTTFISRILYRSLEKIEELEKIS